jgi:hypothetical protein
VLQRCTHKNYKIIAKMMFFVQGDDRQFNAKLLGTEHKWQLLNTTEQIWTEISCTIIS